MLIECPECKNPISDQAKACPHCGVSIGAKKTERLGSRRKATQYIWFFFWIMLVGFFWPVFSETRDTAVIGGIFGVVGMFGWVLTLIYRWTST